MRGLVELDYKVYDAVELEFTFREGAAPETVWAVVAKDELKKIRDERWDLVRPGKDAHGAASTDNAVACRPSPRPPTPPRCRRPWLSCPVSLCA